MKSLSFINLTEKNDLYALLAGGIFFGVLIIEHMLAPLDSCCRYKHNLFQEHYFKPYLADYLVSLLVSLIGERFTIVIGTIVLPAVNFYMAIRIFQTFVDFRWSLALAIVGVANIYEYPFRSFLYDVISFNDIDIAAGNLISASFPLPSLSIFFCLLVFLLCFKAGYLGQIRATTITALTSIQIYLFALDAAFMLFFWFCFYLTKICRQTKFDWLLVSYKFAPHVCLSLLLLSPNFVFVEANALSEAESSFDARYALTYMVLPALLLVVAYVLRNIDPWEILIRFSPIFMAMLLEMSFIFVDISGGLRINFDYLGSGIGQSLLHPLYYIPAIFYLARDPRPTNRVISQNTIKYRMTAAFETCLFIFNTLLLPILILLSLAYLISPIRNMF